MPFDFAGYESEATDTLLHDLIAGRARIARPEQWCKGALGRTIEGKPVPSASLKAVAFCLMGAYLTPELGDWVTVGALDTNDRRLACHAALSAQTPNLRFLPEFNNHPDTTHADVLAVFDRAIAARRKELERT